MTRSPTTQELDAVMLELDSNGDHVVDFPEFLTKFLVGCSARAQAQGRRVPAVRVLEFQTCCVHTR